jgi:hypothetical protein
MSEVYLRARVSSTPHAERRLEFREQSRSPIVHLETAHLWAAMLPQHDLSLEVNRAALKYTAS